MRRVYLLPIIFLVSCSPCGNDQIQVESSPDKKNVAIAFVRNCGATTEYSTQVSILKEPGKLTNEAGNILVLVEKRSLSIGWEGNTKLVVSGSRGLKSTRRLILYRGIEVEYM